MDEKKRLTYVSLSQSPISLFGYKKKNTKARNPSIRFGDTTFSHPHPHALPQHIHSLAPPPFDSCKGFASQATARGRRRVWNGTCGGRDVRWLNMWRRDVRWAGVMRA